MMFQNKNNFSIDELSSNGSDLFDYKIEKSDNFKLIINADDMGLCEERDNAIFELYLKGHISSASILVNGFNFTKSIERARAIKMPLGLHLNLTEGFPIFYSENNSLIKFIDANSTLNYDFRNNKNKIIEITNKNFDYIEEYHEFYGKFLFREKLKNNEIFEIDIKNEIISQIERFIKFYKSPPSHLDGHQHIHIIPEIAGIIAEIMSNYFGIYHIRIPAENEGLFDCLMYEIPYSENRKSFHKKIISDCEESRNLYSKYNIFSTENFMGMTLMGKNFTEENFKRAINIYKQKLLNDSENSAKKYSENNYSLELMIHPGYIGKNGFWDEFNCSEDRLHEKTILEGLFQKNILTQEILINFSDLESHDNTILEDNDDIIQTNNNILILGDITYGTGNLITAQRLKRVFNKLGHKSFMYNIRYLLSGESDDFENLQKFVLNKKIGLIVGINIWRSGKIIYDLLHESNI